MLSNTARPLRGDAPPGSKSKLAQWKVDPSDMVKNQPVQPGLMGQPGADPASLQKTLREHFGFETFRGGQMEVVQAALEGRDTAVFWATGSGKSLCYQLPALHSGKTVVVVSPLISLMLDQVTKFNATVGTAPGRPQACFLGSAQVNPGVESQAARGDFCLVYVTPEKLSTSLIDRFRELHQRGGLALLAVDEAHCISQWGHDFRPAYRELRNVRQGVPGLPIMALTATAVPRVQDDILQQLGMQTSAMFKSSFDRPNLRLQCSRKMTKAADLLRIANEAARDGGSTIVYVPTQAETESIGAFIKERLSSSGVQVRTYHGGMAFAEREESHIDFLSGRAQIIVATVAFGMGIDKPDIRRIVHYGPPKTVEEYFQQVGRAGRDGLNSVCEMITNDNDFNNYSADFYTKGLTAEAKSIQLASTEALRRFASGCGCRRRWLLEYFGEEAQFGTHCGTCDVCTSASEHKDDLTRDFRQPARIVLEACLATEDFPLAMTYLLQIIGGTWKPKNPNFGSDRKRLEAMQRIQRMRCELPPMLIREAFTKELIPMLCSAGYIERRKVTATVGTDFQRTFEVYAITAKGKEWCMSQSEIRLPVPQALRQHEEEERRKAEKRIQELESQGVDTKKIPKAELDSGEGETVKALLAWTRRLTLWKEQGKTNLVQAMEELLKRILAWRDGVAQKLRIAPTAALSEPLTRNIAYSMPTSVEALRAAGVRIAGVEDLATLMQTSVKELFPKMDLGQLEAAAGVAPQASQSAGGNSAAPMRFPAGPWTAPMKWEKAMYKVAKNGKLPAWEEYYNRWARGEHPQAIAMNPPSGKAVKVSTVFGHVMTAMTFAKPVDLGLLAQQVEDSRPPTQQEWEKIEEGAAIRAMNVDGDDYRGKEVLCGILGEENVNREPTQKSESDKALEEYWYGRIRWWEALKRVRFPVTFDNEESSAKRPRLA